MPIACLLVIAAAVPAVAPPIIIDGWFDDWAAVQAAVVDPADAPDAAVDFGELKVTHDDRFVYLMADFGRIVNAQGLDGTAFMLLDVDGDPRTGVLERGLPGTDIVIELTPANRKSPGHPGAGMQLRATGYRPRADDPAARVLTTYDAGLRFSPTFAARRFEFRLDRGAALPDTPPLFAGECFHAKLVFVDLHGDVADETETISHRLSPVAATPPAPAAASAPVQSPARSDSTDLRIVTWNVSRSGFLTNRHPFARALAAIAPDVILLQELTDTTTVEQVRGLLVETATGLPGEAAKDGPWNIIIGQGGGNLRCAIATKLPMTAVDSLAIVAVPEAPQETVRIAAGVIDAGPRRLLVASIHLRCCGRAGGPEDQRREDEAAAVRDAIQAAAPSLRLDGVVIAGDLNLVGSRDPLETLARGGDVDGSALAIADPSHLDGATMDTWRDAKQPFAPGRLDYVLYSDSRIASARALVFDTADLSAAWLQRLRLQPDDTAIASDHLPVVVDLRWIGAPLP